MIEFDEFIGRFSISYKDGEIIYAYDEITHGLYQFTISQKKVTLVVSPIDIYKNTSDRIRGISKYGNEIILIPQYIDSEWVFFNLEEKMIRYNSPIQNKSCISCTATIGENLFLIPSDVYNPIIIVSLDDMKNVKIYEKWYEGNESKKNKDFFIWTISSYADLIVIPIMNSNYIGCVNDRSINIVRVNIPYPIFSASIYKDKIWLLPVEGTYIYAVDYTGMITDKINLLNEGTEISANDFVRIVVTGAGVFLLPIHGKNVCIYQFKKNEIILVRAEAKHLWGGIFARACTPYWDFIIENEILHLLPCDYHYRCINMVSLEDREYSLHYENNIDSDEYWNMINNIRKSTILEERKSDLGEFIQSAYRLCKNSFVEEDRKIGRQIWERKIV